MRIFLLFCLAAFGGLGLFAQVSGTIGFEIDANAGCFELESGFDAAAGHTIIGVNAHIASMGNGDDLSNRANYPIIPLDDSDGDGVYTLDYQPNGTSGNSQMQWYFDAVVSRPGMADTIINELLGNDFTDNTMPATWVWACKIRFAMGPIRTFFMNGPQDRKIRNALGKCLACGDQEWNITMDMTPYSETASSDDPGRVNDGLDGGVNVAFVPGANRLVSYNGSFPQLTMTNLDGNIYSLRLPIAPVTPAGQNEYIVFSFEADFSDKEDAVISPSLDVQACDVFAFGSREYFENSSTDVKSTDFLWGSVGTESPGGQEVAFAANTTVTADKLVNFNGISYYLAGNRKLLAVNYNGQTPAAANLVSVTFGATEAEWVPNGTGFVGNANGGAALLKRTWDINSSIASPVDVQFYLTQPEIDAVNTVLAANGGTAITGLDDMNFYKVTSGEDPQIIADLSPDDVDLYATDNTFAQMFTSDVEDRCPTGNDATLNSLSIIYTVSSFSGGGGGAASMGAAILPVELTQLNASALKSNVMVKWATATESGNEGFTVEHSTNGVDFRAIGTVAGAGTSNRVNDYAFEHVNAPAGVNYYRLQQNDFDGTRSLSHVVTANVDLSEAALSVYPVPADDRLFVSTPGTAGELIIRDVRGRLTQRLTVNGVRQTVDISTLERGMYFISVTDGKEVTTRRFLKQ